MLERPSRHLTSRIQLYTAHTLLCSAPLLFPLFNLSNHDTLFTAPFSADVARSSVSVIVFACVEFADSPSLTSASSIPDSLCGCAIPAEEFNLPARNVIIDAAESRRPVKLEGLRKWLGSAEKDLLLLLRGSDIISTTLSLFCLSPYLRLSGLRRRYVWTSRKGSSAGVDAICLSRIPCLWLCSRNQLYCSQSALCHVACLGVYESKNLVRGKFENRGHHLLSRKNGIHTVAIVMPNHLKKCSGGISVIPNTDCSALDMSRK